MDLKNKVSLIFQDQLDLLRQALAEALFDEDLQQVKLKKILLTCIYCLNTFEYPAANNSVKLHVYIK